MGGAVGWCATVISSAVAQPVQQACKTHFVLDGTSWRAVHYDCPKPRGLLRSLFDLCLSLVWPGIKEFGFVTLACFLGWLVAKVTPRRPADGRKAKICFED